MEALSPRKWRTQFSPAFEGAFDMKATLEILPCTVSQLLSATLLGKDTFSICDWELNQVSLVGIIRGISAFVTNIQYSLDDMTGPPLNVKQWVNTEDCAVMTSGSPGTYMKVIGTLRNYSGQRSLLAMNIRCIQDLNEITSHMLEVVQAHMQLFGKVFDVNMNTTASLSGRCSSRCPAGVWTSERFTIHSQVLHAVRKSSNCRIGISFQDLRTQLINLSMRDIRSSLTFLINEGHVFSTIDEQHFKSMDA
ncbi:replication protein A 32 kDa subunit-like [Echeneis naucrates]|uniref:replication protein A 32 kDa subunit-like n=1 Tax=Echeneis naucrates TaxID=173247 RepID=UPI001113A2C7|nr:replication protein A 32 kDa subunit-like [Echeneis naucrates]